MIKVEKVGEILSGIAGKKILVVGDVMLDRYITGSVSRISPEAPVPVVHVSKEESRPGGAANVALNIQSFGGRAIVAGIVGKDSSGVELAEILRADGIDTAGIIASEKRSTTVKTRIVAERQQVVRVDYETLEPVTSMVMEDFCGRIVDLVKDSEGVIIEDHQKGLVRQALLDTVISAAREAGVPVGFDPNYDDGLRLSGITLATPNYKEACHAAGVKEKDLDIIPNREEVLGEVAKCLQKKWDSDLVILTLGAHGMYLLSRNGDVSIVPARAREVFDVSGAGDTVISAALLAMVAGASHRDAAEFANCAAGVVVGKLGTAVCSPDELKAYVAGFES